MKWTKSRLSSFAAAASLTLAACATIQPRGGAGAGTAAANDLGAAVPALAAAAAPALATGATAGAAPVVRAVAPVLAKAVVSGSTADPASGAASAPAARVGAPARVNVAVVHPPGPPPPPVLANVGAIAARTQSFAPVAHYGVFLIGAHFIQNHPEEQFLAFHYCQVSTADFLQCSLYDSGRPDANLTGIEYIISERLFNLLPREEKGYWHPHNYEILSGQLLAPGLPPNAQQTLMKLAMNSYGKTWHTWMSHPRPGSTENLPYGKPVLAWSFNHDGEELPAILALRDAFAPTAAAEKATRAALGPLAHPQQGVDRFVKDFVNQPAAAPLNDTSSLDPSSSSSWISSTGSNESKSSHTSGPSLPSN